MKSIRVLLIEDNRLLRAGITAMLKGQRGIKVVASSGNGENSILKIHRLKPAIILLDIGLRSQSSLHIVEMLKNEFPRTRIIVVDLAPAQGDVAQFVKAGACGFILRDATPGECLATIRSVADGNKVLPPVHDGSLISGIIGHAINKGKISLNKSIRMTKREKEVVGLISEGLNNKEIGERLQAATHTIKSHVHNIMEKLALHTRLEVANFAYADGALLREIAKTLTLIHR
jgi:two-component system nitrate/nitrite response regulator NarL